MKLINEKVVDVTSESKVVNDIDEHFVAHLTFENGAVAHLEGAIDQNKNRYALIKGEKGSIIFRFMKDAFSKWWEDYDTIIDSPKFIIA